MKIWYIFVGKLKIIFNAWQKQGGQEVTFGG